jgi:hypothetical protein
MTSGYLMASAYADELKDFPVARVKDQERHKWDFLRIEDPLYTRGENRKVQERIERMLDVASQKAFKIWSLSTPLKVFAWLLAMVLLAGYLWLWVIHPEVPLLQILPPYGWSVTVGSLGWTAAFMLLAVLLNRVLGGFLSRTAMALVQWRETIKKFIHGLVRSSAGWLVARTHIHLFDRAFLAKGRLKRVLK